MTITEASGISTHEPLTDLVEHWIDGSRHVASGSETLPVNDPATGAIARHVTLADSRVIDAAVASSLTALDSWKRLPLSRRMPILHALRAELLAHRELLIETIAAEHGKVPDDAAGEVARGLEIVELACMAPQLLKGSYSERVAGGIDTFSLRQPVGVCVGITPFNFPAMVPLWMFPVALACGNTFILKPSERDPSASLVLAEIAQRAGVPDGVLNVVQGDRRAVEGLIDHPGVAAVSFVGSTPIARSVYERAASRGKRVQALGGAKNHVVVLPDADVEQAADAVVSAAFGSSGQRCMAISVAVAVGDVAESLLSAVEDRVRHLRVGAASEADAEMGPLITAAARDRVNELVASGEDSGARILVDGRQSEATSREGFFTGPSVLDGVTPGMAVYDQEVFGPLLSVTRASTLEEAIGLINANPYGNGAAIFTASGAAAHLFHQEVEAGMVGINVPIPVPVGYYSFGGWGDSLFGDTHLYGPEGFQFYTRGKVVTSRWPADERRSVNLSFPG